MSNTYVKDPRDVVKSGDVVRVKVLEVDVARKRIGLSLRLTDEAKPTRSGTGSAGDGSAGGTPVGRPKRDHPQARPAQKPPRSEPSASTTMADALRRAGLGRS
jgi:uncharacterized protein